MGRDRYLWLEKTVKLPEAREGSEVTGLFDFGKTGGGYNQGFESLLYVDGHPFQGVDTNHNEVIFRGMEGKEVRLTFLLWTGLEGGGEHTTFSTDADRLRWPIFIKRRMSFIISQGRLRKRSSFFLRIMNITGD